MDMQPTTEAAPTSSPACNVTITALVAPTPEPLTSLPLDVLDIIIHHAGKGTWLALFRTCRQLRDIVASQAAAGWSKKLRTRLIRAVGDQPPWWSSKYSYNSQTWHEVMGSSRGSINMLADGGSEWVLSWLESQNESTGLSNTTYHMHLHLAAAASEDTSVLQTRQPVPAPAQSMVCFLISGWPAAPLHVAALQHITCIRLEGVLLDHALPECIGRSCPALRDYQLHSVKWRRSLWSVRPWPQLQHLTLQDSGSVNQHQGMFKQYLQFNANTLPGLSSLHVQRRWGISSYSSELQRAYAGCSAAFSSHLTSLTMDIQPSGDVQAAPNMLLSMPSLALPRLTILHIDAAVVTAAQLTSLLNAAPMLAHLKLHGLSLLSSCAHITCILQSFAVTYKFKPFVAGIARLPRMPNLASFDLPRCDYELWVLSQSTWLLLSRPYHSFLQQSQASACTSIHGPHDACVHALCR